MARSYRLRRRSSRGLSAIVPSSLVPPALAAIVCAVLSLSAGLAGAQTITNVHVSSGAVQGNASAYNDISMSDDGRYVGFASDATNLVAGDTNGQTDVFVHDRATGTTV